jgi:phosphatidate cytidylyltransferase
VNKNLFSYNSFLRLLSSIFLISVSMYSVLESGTLLIATISILIFILTYEYISFTETIDTLFLKTTKSFLNVTIFLLSIFTIYFSIIFYCIVFLLYLFQKNTSKVNNIFVFIGPIYLCLPFIFLYNIRLSNFGLDTILWFLLIVWSTDSFSYIGGNIFGGKKLILSLSPKKTWSGFICGILVACIVSIICFYIKNYNILVGLTYGFIIALFTQFGDLFESWIKRKHRVKDSGILIPGHGGFLDRVDGLLFSSVILYIGFIFYE